MDDQQARRYFVSFTDDKNKMSAPAYHLVQKAEAEVKKDSLAMSEPPLLVLWAVPFESQLPLLGLEMVVSQLASL